MPYAPSQVAELGEGQQQAIQQAMSGVGAYAPYLQAGQAAVGQGITGAQQAAYTPTSYQQFMDPYMEDVIQQQYRDIARQGQIQEQQLGAQAVGAGAFGGARQGVAQAELGRSVMEQQARTGSQLRSAGFGQAQAAAQQAAQQQLAQAQLGGALGAQMAGLGQLGQQMGVQDINTLLGIGGLQQQQSAAARVECGAAEPYGSASSTIPAGWVLVRCLPWCTCIAANLSGYNNSST
jgi:hypothetical protein